jgi:hypothetical protein
MTGYAGTAIRAALLSFEETLRVVSVTQTRVLGRTQDTESAPKTFSGVIAPAEEWRQVITQGGVISGTQPVLIVDSDLVDTLGAALSISKNDILIRGDGQRFKVLSRLDEAERYGVVLYTLTEHRT